MIKFKIETNRLEEDVIQKILMTLSKATEKHVKLSVAGENKNIHQDMDLKNP